MQPSGSLQREAPSASSYRAGDVAASDSIGETSRLPRLRRCRSSRGGGAVSRNRKPDIRNDTATRIASYLDIHGWDKIRDPDFHEWLREQGIDSSTLAVWPKDQQLSLGLYEMEPLG